MEASVTKISGAQGVQWKPLSQRFLELRDRTRLGQGSFMMCGRNALMKCNRIAWRFFATKPIVRCFPSYSNAGQLNITPWRSGSKCLNLDFSNLSPSMPCFRMNMPTVSTGDLSSQAFLPNPEASTPKPESSGPIPNACRADKA